MLSRVHDAEQAPGQGGEPPVYRLDAGRYRAALAWSALRLALLGVLVGAGFLLFQDWVMRRQGQEGVSPVSMIAVAALVLGAVAVGLRRGLSAARGYRLVVAAERVHIDVDAPLASLTIRRSDVGSLWRVPTGLHLHLHDGRSAVIPATLGGFEEVVATLSAWGPVTETMPRSVQREAVIVWASVVGAMLAPGLSLIVEPPALQVMLMALGVVCGVGVWRTVSRLPWQRPWQGRLALLSWVFGPVLLHLLRVLR